MRASRRLPALNLFQGRLAPPTDGGGGAVGSGTGRQRHPGSTSSAEHPNLPHSPAGGREGGRGGGGTR